MNRLTKLFLTSLTLLVLSACGGGGGGSSAPTSLVYSGNTNAAVITLENAATLVGNALYGGEAGMNIPVAVTLTEQTTIRSAGAVVQSEILRNISKNIRDGIFKNSSSLQDLVVGVDLNEPLECDSGSGNISGTLNDSTFTGTLTVTYINCRLDGTTYNGTGTLRIDAFDLNYIEISDATMAFTLLTISSSEFTGSMSGTIRIQSMIVSNTEKMTLNYVSKDSLTGKMYKFENMVITIVYDQFFTPTSMTETITGNPGRAYDSVHGFVDVNTIVPLVYSSVLLANPDSEGVVIFTGAADTSIRVTVLSGQHIKLEINIDGIPDYEVLRYLLWEELNVNAKTNIRDTDSDGMHDSWELDYGLDPLDETDATQDADGDGFNNVDEYQYGTNPGLATSFPPSANLLITMAGSSEYVAVDGTLLYTITVTNSGPNVADEVIITVTLPTNLAFNTVSAFPGTCSETSSIICNMGTLGAGAAFNYTISIMATPTTVGSSISIASVTSNAFDLDVSNNSTTETTIIGGTTSIIQDQIDTAIVGDTIFVGPGLYIGELNFNGKDITIESVDGPDNTIIASDGGFNSTAVNIGPGGVITGFTIANASSHAINVHGSGAMIKGNIFQANQGSSGVAIFGNTASPFIEQNIFRNNICDNQFLSATVSFVNASSPVIINNVFENNSCRGINFTLPTGNAPTVINNTFMANRAAIRVDRRVSQGAQVYRNNIIVQNEIGFEVEFGTDADNPIWENNLVFGNTVDYFGTADQTGINSNISGDPLFVDTSISDYHLQTGSPAIDAGSELDAPAVDFDGVSRPIDGDVNGSAATDIGAFEAL
jgi:uncharacterized repeat protein (TIGR01451 family)